MLFGSPFDIKDIGMLFVAFIFGSTYAVDASLAAYKNRSPLTNGQAVIDRIKDFILLLV
jgi:hypothetical protein